MIWNTFRILWSAIQHTQNIYVSLVGEIQSEFKASCEDYSKWSSRKLIQGLSCVFWIRLPIRCPSWMPICIKHLVFGTDSSYHPATKEICDDGVCVLFVNGILTDVECVRSNCDALENLLNRPVNILHNATDSVLSDLVECFLGKSTNELTEPSRLLLKVLCLKLKDSRITKILLISHSQGTIIVAKALAHLHEEGVCNDKYLKKLDVFTFANCASHMTYLRDSLPFMEHYVNDNDIVGKLGCNCHEDVSQWVKIDGTTICASHSGHLLISHYLYHFSEHFPNAKLLNYKIKTKNKKKTQMTTNPL